MLSDYRGFVTLHGVYTERSECVHGDHRRDFSEVTIIICLMIRIFI